MRRSFWGCSHDSTVTTITAGMAREVCEVCSHVSVRYIEPAVRFHLDDNMGDDTMVFEARITFEAMGRSRPCRYCSQTAVYLIPNGLTCNEHAWQAAARLDWVSSEVWVPIPIHPSNA